MFFQGSAGTNRTTKENVMFQPKEDFKRRLTEAAANAKSFVASLAGYAFDRLLDRLSPIGDLLPTEASPSPPLSPTPTPPVASPATAAPLAPVPTAAASAPPAPAPRPEPALVTCRNRRHPKTGAQCTNQVSAYNRTWGLCAECVHPCTAGCGRVIPAFYTTCRPCQETAQKAGAPITKTCR
ncbi:MAG: hypothetical protein HYV42_05700 [Candidatus Magasanikbacteria bacterium]|nr:hypothetical protein [Candidatus Magasanikbacteria bacterium]